ncbi:hypothetical protein HPP92_026303 [Vanilla planifolia]|uniref:Uncharacterized protein n=1 Tax=Vanilla planifolia TaxID=51239 RepID=A0A835PH16_VANPL|nr:hypothetical protein HPP92_026303 [Vanilla planifolia]
MEFYLMLKKFSAEWDLPECFNCQERSGCSETDSEDEEDSVTSNIGVKDRSDREMDRFDFYDDGLFKPTALQSRLSRSGRLFIKMQFKSAHPCAKSSLLSPWNRQRWNQPRTNILPLRHRRHLLLLRRR